jgi:hypothetical protein
MNSDEARIIMTTGMTANRRFSRRQIRSLRRSWLMFVLVVGVLNVPIAVTQMRSRTAPRPRTTVQLRGDSAPAQWPAATPHPAPWPRPTYWLERRAWGYREYDVRTEGAEGGSVGFIMNVRHTGWPLPVIEQKQMWWDWNNPALTGPEPDPRPAVLVSGLILNPLLVGTAAFCLLHAGPSWVLLRRRARLLDLGRCLGCGYLIRTESARCPECGRPVAPGTNRRGETRDGVPPGV